MTGDVDALAGLRAAARVGPYFAIEPSPTGHDWRPLGDLIDRPDAVRDRVRAARAQLAERTRVAPDAVESRALASTVFLGLAARLVSPALGATLLTGAVPDLRAGRLYWRPTEGGPLPLAADGARARPVADPTELLVEWCLRDPVEPLLARFHTEFRLSPKVLWGNVASALGGAIRLLGQDRPALAEAAARLGDRLLALPPLAGTGALVRPDPAVPSWFFVRRSCCLYYRLPGGGLCGDCVLVPEDERRRQWRADQPPGSPS